MGRHELATSLLVLRGEVRDAITTTYDYQQEEYVWPHVKEACGNRTSTREVNPAHLATMAGFLADFSGICNFNYKVRPNGELSIFEVNTRMGSDLGCDVPMPMLRELFRKLDSFWEEDDGEWAPS